MFPTWLDIWLSVNAEPVSTGQSDSPQATEHTRDASLSKDSAKLNA